MKASGGLNAVSTDLSFRGVPTPGGLILMRGFIGGATWNPFSADGVKMAMAFKKRQRSRPLLLFEGVRLRCLSP